MNIKAYFAIEFVITFCNSVGLIPPNYGLDLYFYRVVCSNFGKIDRFVTLLFNIAHPTQLTSS